MQDYLLYGGIAAIFILGFASQARNRQRRKARQGRAVDDLAQATGLFQTSGESGEIILQDHQGLRLSLRPSTGKAANRANLPDGNVTLFCPEPRMAGGLVVVIPELDPQMGKALQVFAGGLDNKVGVGMATRIFGADVAEQIGGLRDFSSADHPDMTVLSVVDPAPFVDVAGLAALVRAVPWRQGATPLPSVILGPAGMTLRTPRLHWQAEVLGQLVALARAIRR
jgi:hypothetical protein